MNKIWSIGLKNLKILDQLTWNDPLLFIAYIDEDVKVSNLHGTSNDTYLHTDDAKLFRNNVDNLQTALDRFSAWLYSCQLNLAPTKCEHLLHIFRFSNSVDYNFQLCSHNINIVTTVRDLGVFISYNLKWSQHIPVHHIHSTASVCADQISQAFSL